MGRAAWMGVMGVMQIINESGELDGCGIDR